MSGVFPDSGVTPSQARNSILNPNVAEGCLPLFYSSTRCNPRFDPAAANALMSEFINAVNGAGLEYDCTKLDNLLRAIKALAFNPGSIFTFITPGPQSIIVPANKSYAEIELIGGGGGGGSIAAVGQAAAGGNGGDLVRDTILVTPGATINFNVGSGGPTQASPATATNGGDSTMDGGFVAKGGRGAPAFATSGGAASPGSVGSVGAYIISGQIGEYGMVLGGGAGDRIGGRGGSSGNGTQGGNGAFNGGTGANPGQQPGGGGGGASGGSGFSAGGSGATGRVTLTFF